MATAAGEPVEKALQEGLDRLNRERPAEHDAPFFTAIFRHPCSGHRIAQRTGKPVSTPIDLKERYVSRWVEEGGAIHGEFHSDDDYVILYREGVCKNKRCQQTARSAVGRVALVADRAPITGRVGRE